MPKTLVFLAASPADKARLRVDSEEREIEAELQRSKLRDEFVTIYQPALRFDDLLHVLREQKPYIVHFSGHGEGGMGLVLEDEQGKAKFLENEVLTNIFEQLKGHTHCVVLNACYSEVQVLAIAQHVPYVVGMNARVPDRVAVEFARQFYAGLGAGETLEQAFHWAKVALLGMDQSGAQIPVLYKDGKPLETHESKVLAPKQRSFVERIFSDYVELNRPVLILAQEGFQTQHYIQALKDKAKTRFKVLHVFPPASDQVSEAEYFAYLARQCGLGEGISNSTQWYLALSERLMQGLELLLLITGFENGAEQYRRSFAGEVRNLLGAFPHDLHLIMFGGERLAAMKFEQGALSLLNFISPSSRLKPPSLDGQIYLRY
ncbi:MAG: CHAT domain-containing protein [Thiofilum sp.]|uniref:CHAT domain-containing protein n=1 Tax=Thiofilum sp. TaxID=2212733 RepID=UPI0026000509|nr:CHAT domain-containing protein [Thiofilum sp.]MBK8454948.1 CHAT domain-containing protein [Thiofilum sp.]